MSQVGKPVTLWSAGDPLVANAGVIRAEYDETRQTVHVWSFYGPDYDQDVICARADDDEPAEGRWTPVE